VIGRARPARGQAGQTLPLLTIFMVVLLGFAGLVIDVGHAYMLKRHLQASVDMAVLAGAQQLPSPASPSAATVAEDMLEDNYNPMPQPDATASPCAAGTNEICLEASTDVDTTFLRLFDVDAFDIGADATAAISTYDGFSNVAPWAVTSAHVAAGAGYTSDFKLRGRDDYGHPSIRGTISIRSGNSCGWSNGVDERRILNRTLAVCEIGVAGADAFAETIEEDAGGSNGHIDGLNQRGARQPCDAACLGEFTVAAPGGRLKLTDDTHPNVILIPRVTSWDRTHEMPVVGFVWFAITKWGGTGGEGDSVYGRFLDAPGVISTGAMCNGTACSEGEYFAGSPGGKLVRLIG
jgi:hypothetical protein